ncbi:MAG: hypothetical protein ACRD12_08495, partial [Acidimicrobiales bacterium]
MMLASGVTALAALAGCTGGAAERVADRPCSPQPPALYAAVDVSDSGRSPALVGERLDALERVLTDT